uniref:Uncharacterized protein n=1 Tax=Magallana gigas TaxID=29159 RepID=A0A8W8JTQ2_MAGGI
MSRYLEQQPAIFATFHHKDVKKNIKDIVTLSETEKSEAEELVNILGPLKKMTTILCSEHSPTVSLVHPMREMLLREMARKSSTSQMVRVKKEPGTDTENNDNPTPQLPTLQDDADLQNISMENEAETQSK